MKPTLTEAVNHLREHYGLSMPEVLGLLRTPLHPAGLRDEFAGRALIGAMSRGWRNPSEVAKEAFAAADAMMEARNANR